MRKAARKNKSTDYRTLRAKLLTQGMTLRMFALENGYGVQTVYDAAKGRRAGPTAMLILQQLEEMTNATS